MRKLPLAVAAALVGCAGPPLVDMNDVNPVAYQRDFDQCQIEAQWFEPAGPIVAGVIIGGSFGLGLGAIGSGVPATTAAEGYGAAAGAVTGAGVSAIAGPPPATTGAAPRQSMADCLASHGYKVIAGAK